MLFLSLLLALHFPVHMTAVTGGEHQHSWNGLQLGLRLRLIRLSLNTGSPSPRGTDQRVILTNQEQAILAYIKRSKSPDVWE